MAKPQETLRAPHGREVPYGLVNPCLTTPGRLLANSQWYAGSPTLIFIQRCPKDFGIGQLELALTGPKLGQFLCYPHDFTWVRPCNTSRPQGPTTRSQVRHVQVTRKCKTERELVIGAHSFVRMLGLSRAVSALWENLLSHSSRHCRKHVVYLSSQAAATKVHQLLKEIRSSSALPIYHKTARQTSTSHENCGGIAEPEVVYFPDTHGPFRSEWAELTLHD